MCGHAGVFPAAQRRHRNEADNRFRLSFDLDRAGVGRGVDNRALDYGPLLWPATHPDVDVRALHTDGNDVGKAAERRTHRLDSPIDTLLECERVK